MLFGNLEYKCCKLFFSSRRFSKVIVDNFPSNAAIYREDLIKTLGVINEKESFLNAVDEIERNVDFFESSPNFAIPEVRFSQIEHGRFPVFLAKQIRRKGVVVIREAVHEANALRWRDSVIDYLLQNSQWIKPPTEYPRYWSYTQLQARENLRILTILSALNSLWHSTSSISLWKNFLYCDRLCVGKPCNPHGTGMIASSSTPSFNNWLCPDFSKVYHSIFTSHFETWDPFNANFRSKLDSKIMNGWSNIGSFRPWQGFLSLSPWLQYSGTLKIVPLLQASVAYTLLEPFINKNNNTYQIYSEKESNSKSMMFNEFSHGPLLRALVSLPPLSAGDAVFWHPDIVIKESVPENIDREYVALYISSLPVCEGNKKYVEHQKQAFISGKTPHPDRGAHCRFSSDEAEFSNRATEVNLTAKGKIAMGLVQNTSFISPKSNRN